ncbi:craniofacial development protein 2-like [Malaya genurostris]|uniref:craniofacial development protein 2-like n=1 Tax=Malaya genurostris TaxID=325434 RepID=UPI0026F3924F|nr:craniofacial development protein 2-like [Malaya genurostris]
MGVEKHMFITRPLRRKRTRDWKLGTWNCKSLNFIGSTRILSDIVKDRKFDIVALQEVCWKGSTVRVFRGNHTIYQSCGNTHELGTAFMVVGEIQKRVIGWWPVSDRICRLRIKGRFFNISIINVHSPHLGSSDDDKDEFYAQLEREYDRCPRHDIKIVIGDFNAQVGQEVEFRPVVGRFSAHQQTNENGLRLIDFATSKNMAIKSTFFQHRLLHRYTWRSPVQTETQIDHVLIDGRHFSDIIDVRTYRGANIDSDHYLVMVKLRPKLSVVNNVRYRRPPRYNLDRLRDTEVATAYARHLEAVLLAEEELNDAPLEDCWTRTKAAISNAAESVLGYVPRSRRNECLFRAYPNNTYISCHIDCLSRLLVHVKEFPQATDELKATREDFRTIPNFATTTGPGTDGTEAPVSRMYWRTERK